MRERLCLFLYIIHFTQGCYISGYTVFKTVTGYTGGSVLLPCACKDSQSKPEAGFTWSYLLNDKENQWTDVFKDEKYKNRLKLFNQSSPANLSLLISDLRKKDEGHYWCQTSSNFTVIRVTIKGCDLDQNKQTLQLTGHSGESVVLLCSCTELRAKPQQLTWTFTPLNHRTKPKEIHPNEESKQHTGRVKLNETSPGNLSLHISNLKREDEGEYRCSELQQHVNITLSVLDSITPTTEQSEEGSAKQFFILVSVLTVLLLLGVLALIYWICRGRRSDQIMTNAALVLVCSENKKMGDLNLDSLTQGQNLKQDENEDEVTYSSVVYVQTTAKSHIETVMTEHSEYASIN